MQERLGRRYGLYILATDEEFARLHVPAPADHIKRLEKEIIKTGATKPVMTWRGYIVDGHKRYEIFHRHNIPFFKYDLELETRYDVMEWICDKSLRRQDLSEEYRKYFIGKKMLLRYKKFEFKEGLEQADAEQEGGSALPETKYKIAAQIGKAYHLSYGTVKKYSQYTTAIDAIRKYEPSIAENILSGKVRVSHENVVSVSHFSQDQIHLLKEIFTDGKHEKIQSSHIWNELRWSCLHPSVPAKKKLPEVEAEIKKMPKYDPDAELQSLALTIPTWKSSIERVMGAADFDHASERAKINLLIRLSSLSDTIKTISQIIKETDNEQRNGTGAGSGAVRAAGTLRTDTDKEPGLEPGISEKPFTKARPESCFPF